MVRRFTRLFFVVCLVASAGAGARADDIIGVQPAALDQPRIYMTLRRQANGKNLTVTVDKETTGAVEAFLDTGASGIMLAHQTAKSLGVTTQKDVEFSDIGVGGSEKFEVSE